MTLSNEKVRTGFDDVLAIGSNIKILWIRGFSMIIV
jgi:hypothetical protein